MAIYTPPIIRPLFSSSDFDESIPIDEVVGPPVGSFLEYPVAQGAITLQDTFVNGTCDCIGQINALGNCVADNVQVEGDDILGTLGLLQIGNTTLNMTIKGSTVTFRMGTGAFQMNSQLAISQALTLSGNLNTNGPINTISSGLPPSNLYRGFIINGTNTAGGTICSNTINTTVGNISIPTGTWAIVGNAEVVSSGASTTLTIGKIQIFAGSFIGENSNMGITIGASYPTNTIWTGGVNAILRNATVNPISGILRVNMRYPTGQWLTNGATNFVFKAIRIS